VKRKRFTEGLVIGVLAGARAGREDGRSVPQARDQRGDLSKFGDLDDSEAKRLKQLEGENARLKRLLADSMLDNAALKDLLSKKMVAPAVKREAVAHLRQVHEMSERVPGDRLPASDGPLPVPSHRRHGLAGAPAGAGPGTSALWLSQAPRSPAPRRFCRKPQAAIPHLSGRTADGARAWWSQKGFGNGGADPCPAAAQRTLVPRLRFRSSLAAVADTSHFGRRVALELDLLIGSRGGPGSDNGELTSNAILGWADQTRVGWNYIGPGGRLRDEFLNETLFTSLMQARLALEEWRRDYNNVRPHSRIRWLAPAVYAANFSPQSGQRATLAEGSARDNILV
jgi:putative transposase